MKRERYDLTKNQIDEVPWTMQTQRIVLTLSHLRALHDTLRKTFLKVTINEMYRNQL